MALSEFPRLSFDPFTELRRMQSEMNRLFSGFSTATARDFPPINILLGENSVVVTAELAGVPADDVNLNLQEDVLTLGGKREPKTRQENVNWQRRERAYGAFSRAVQLPFRVDPDKQILLRENHPVPITPKAFDTLLILVRHSREVVSKDENWR